MSEQSLAGAAAGTDSADVDAHPTQPSTGLATASASPATGSAPSGLKQKRKVDDSGTPQGSVKVARKTDALGGDANQSASVDNDTEVAASLYAMCDGGEVERLACDPFKDPLIAIAMCVHHAQKDQPPSRDNLGNVSAKVWYYGDSCNTDEFTGLASVDLTTAFTQCESELDMLVAWKKFFDEVDPAVIVGHQVQVFDLWYIVSRGTHLGLPAIATLESAGTPVVLDRVLPAEILAGAGGSSSYPVSTFQSKRANVANAVAGSVDAPRVTFNRRLELQGRTVDDIWERAQGRFTLRAYDMRSLTTNFVAKNGDPVVPEVRRGQSNVVSKIPGVALAHAYALLRIRQVIRSLPALVPFCFRCKEPGHNAKNCTFGVVCKICKVPGHKVTHCPAASCHLCGRKGHMSTACYKAAVCSKCFQVGHTAQYCRRQLKCSSCGQTGHSVDTCFSVNPCSHCGGRHSSQRCYKVHLCSICNRIGHMENRCFMAGGGPAQHMPVMHRTYPAQHHMMPVVGQQNMAAHMQGAPPLHRNISRSAYRQNRMSHNQYQQSSSGQVPRYY